MKPEDRCYLNLVQAFNEYGLPIPVVFVAAKDRVKFPSSPSFKARYAELCAQDKIVNRRENRARHSMEFTFIGDMVEVDFDYFNPEYGWGVALCHLCEVLYNQFGHKTDPFRIARGRGYL